MNKKSLNEVYKQTTFRNVKRVNGCRENTAKDNARSPVYLFVFFFRQAYVHRSIWKRQCVLPESLILKLFLFSKVNKSFVSTGLLTYQETAEGSPPEIQSVLRSNEQQGRSGCCDIGFNGSPCYYCFGVGYTFISSLLTYQSPFSRFFLKSGVHAHNFSCFQYHFLPKMHRTSTVMNTD